MAVSKRGDVRAGSAGVRRTLWSLAAALALVLAACGGGGGTSDTSQGSGSQSQSASAPAEGTTEQPEASPSETGGSGDTGGDTASADLEPVSLRLLELAGIPEATISFFTQADGLGVFEEFNIDAEILTSAGGGPPKIQALLADEADVVVSDVASVASAMNQGAPIKAIQGMTSHYGAVIVARKEYQSLEDLRGQNYGVPSLGGTARILTDFALQEEGLLGALNYLAVGGSPEMVPALEGGRIAAGTFAPSVLPLMRENPELNVLVENTAAIHDRLPNMVLVTTEEKIQQMPEAFERLAKAMLTSQRLIAEDFANYQKTVEAMMPGNYTEQQLRDLWESTTGNGFWAVNGGIHFEALTAVYDAYYALPDAVANPTITEGSQIYDTQFIDAALDELGMVDSEFDQPDWR